MDFTQIEESLKALNYEWYLAKKRFFELESNYDKESNRIEIKYNFRTELFEDASGNLHPEEIYDSTFLNFHDYCWNADFESSLSQNNIEFDESDSPVEKHTLPTDVYPIVQSILKYTKVLFSNVSNVTSSFYVLQNILKRIEAALVPLDNDEVEYLAVKAHMYERIKIVILQRHRNIVELYSLQQGENKEHTIPKTELYNRICAIRFGKTSLQESFEPLQGCKITAGEYLCNITSTDPSGFHTGYFNINAEPHEFDDFLIALNKYIRFNFGLIQKNKSFVIDGKAFSYGAFRNYKSTHKKNTKPFPAIDALFSSSNNT